MLHFGYPAVAESSAHGFKYLCIPFGFSEGLLPSSCTAGAQFCFCLSLTEVHLYRKLYRNHKLDIKLFNSTEVFSNYEHNLTSENFLFQLGLSCLPIGRTLLSRSLRLPSSAPSSYRCLCASQLVLRPTPLAACAFTRFQSTTVKEDTPESPPDYVPVYRFNYLRGVRLISRLKIYQTAWSVILCMPMAGYYAMGHVEGDILATTVGISAFACVMLYVMSSYFSRAIGLISLSRDNKTVRLSHLDFWGKRKDVFVDIDNVLPLSELPERITAPYIKLKRYDVKDFLLFSIRYGIIVDRDKFELIFGNLEQAAQKK